MTNCGDTHTGKSFDRPSLEIADIFRNHGEAYRKIQALSFDQFRVMGNIETCRTSIRGGHMDTCDHCGHNAPSYNSCGDRHCPKCQAIHQAKWINGRKERILPTDYFHLVFTLPAQLRSLALCNRKIIFNMLFATVAETLSELGNDEKYLGAILGITSILHTWTRKLDFHPHVHCVVTGGGLDVKNDRWINSKPGFLFPVRVLSKLFRGKFLHALSRAKSIGKLEFAGGCADLEDQKNFNALKDKLYKKDWVVYAKQPFGGPAAVFEYLGRYTHRVAISNQRIIAMDEKGVTFFTKNGSTETLAHKEFIRRFLMHVLPSKFTKIRHYGLLAATNVNTKLVRAKELLETQNPESSNELEAEKKLSEKQLEKILQENLTPTTCPKCGLGCMVRYQIERGQFFLNAVTKRDTS